MMRLSGLMPLPIINTLNTCATCARRSEEVRTLLKSISVPREAGSVIRCAHVRADRLPFPTAPDPADEQRRAKELDARLKLLVEVSRVICYRAVRAEAFSRQHKGWWQEGWQLDKADRLHALARIIASPEFAGFVRD
jgi:hypothetical protein